MPKKKDIRNVSSIEVNLDAKEAIKTLQLMSKSFKKINKELKILDKRVGHLERWRAKGY